MIPVLVNKGPWGKTTGSCHLAGMGVLVTRPAHQARTLSEKIEAAHGRPLQFPALEILPMKDLSSARKKLGDVSGHRLLIFISSNAVHHALPLMPDELPMDLEIGAIGQATAKALEFFGLDPSIKPIDRFDSEGLLALPELQELGGQSILIIRGEGGRETLAETLKKRGAEVDYVEVYRRVLPQRNPANLLRQWHQLVEVVVVTSNAILDNLVQMLGKEGLDLLQQTPMVLVSQRTADHARSLGITQCHIAQSAHDEDILKCLCALIV